MLTLTVVSHPLLKHKLALLRDRRTDYSVFRALVSEITYLMVYEATRKLRTKGIRVETPISSTRVDILNEEIVVVPVLRAGLGMLDGCLDLVPTAKVGFMGVYRDEETLEPVEYYLKAPPLKKAVVIVLDPMLATGGTVIKVIHRLKERGASKIKFLCIVASPRGIKRFVREHPDVEIICASVDKKLDRKGYIIPGLGDCGDRLYGTGDAPGWQMSPK